MFTHAITLVALLAQVQGAARPDFLMPMHRREVPAASSTSDSPAETPSPSAFEKTVKFEIASSYEKKTPGYLYLDWSTYESTEDKNKKSFKSDEENAYILGHLNFSSTHDHRFFVWGDEHWAEKGENQGGKICEVWLTAYPHRVLITFDLSAEDDKKIGGIDHVSPDFGQIHVKCEGGFASGIPSETTNPPDLTSALTTDSPSSDAGKGGVDQSAVQFEEPLLITLLAPSDNVTDPIWYLALDDEPKEGDKDDLPKDKWTPIDEQHKLPENQVRVGQMKQSSVYPAGRQYVWQTRSDQSQVVVRQCLFNITADPKITELYFSGDTQEVEPRKDGKALTGDEKKGFEQIFTSDCRDVEGDEDVKSSVMKM